MQHLHDEIEAVRRKANEVLSNDRATNTDVANATNINICLIENSTCNFITTK